MKKIRILALALALLLLAGCTKTDTEAKDPQTGQTTAAPELTEGTEPPKTVYCLTGITATLGDLTVSVTVTYDENGIHATPESGYGETAVDYDYSGKILKETYYNEDGTVYFTTDYIYDQQGWLIKRQDLKADGSDRGYDTYEYDENGNLIRQTGISSSGHTSQIYEYTYDAEGHLLQEDYMNHEGILSLRDVYTLDGQGRPLRQTQYIMPDEFQDGYYTYSYNDAGQVLSKVYTDTDGKPHITQSSSYLGYDEAGRVTSFYETSDFFDTWNYQYTYDEQGYLVASAELVDGITTTFRYE